MYRFRLLLAVIILLKFSFTTALCKRSQAGQFLGDWPITEIQLKTKKHPHLFFNEKEIEKIKKLANVEGTYQQKRFKEMKQNAEAWLVRPMPIPERGGEGGLFFHCTEDGSELIYDPDSPDEHVCPKCSKAYKGEKYSGWWRAMTHLRISEKAKDLAFVYALTGDDKYAAECAQILLKYATLYPKVRIINLARLGREALDEVRLLFSFAEAYDLIYNTKTLNNQQKRLIENDLFRKMASLIQIGHGVTLPDRIMGGFTNFQAHMNAGIGVTGFLLGDREMVEFAINGLNGFNRLMQDAVLDNGLWWEGSILYHNFVLTWQTYLAEAAWHSGIDLYKNEKFRRMYLIPFLLAFPDGTYPATNDWPFWYLDDPLHPRRLAEIYYARTGAREVEPFLIPDQITGFTIFTTPVDLALGIAPTWSVPEIPHLKSQNLSPSFGILRTDHAENPIYLLMDYGPHGGTHGHADKLNIILWANGRIETPDLGVCYYALPQWREWYKQTISHNTVVVDEQSQYPSIGRLNLFQVSPRAKIMDGSIASDKWSSDVDFPIYASPIPRTRRTIALLDESFVVDLFRVSQGSVFDWTYRNFGTFHTDESLTPQDGTLGNANGYQHITKVRRGNPSSDSWTGTWSREGQGVRLTLVGMKGTEIIVGDGLGPSLTETVPMVIARRKNPGLFKAVIEPFRGELSIVSVKEFPVQDGVGLKIDKKECLHYFLLAYGWGERTFGEVTFKGHLAYIVTGRDNAKEDTIPSYLYLVDSSRIRQASFSLSTDVLTTLYLERLSDDKYILEHQGRVNANIQMTGLDWRKVEVRELGRTDTLKKTVRTHLPNDQTLVFDIEAMKRYYISLK